MDPIVLNSIPFQLDAVGLRKKLHMKEGSHHAEELDCLIQEAQTIGKPKALYKEAFIESRTDETVTVDGITFKSRVLRVNLDNVLPGLSLCVDLWTRIGRMVEKDRRFPSRVLGGGNKRDRPLHGA